MLTILGEDHYYYHRYIFIFREGVFRCLLFAIIFVYFLYVPLLRKGSRSTFVLAREFVHGEYI